MTSSRIKAIANLVVELLLIVNMALTVAGKTPLPMDEGKVLEVVYMFLTGLQTLRVWWLNQNMTVEAETAQTMLDEMKANENEPDGTGDPEDEILVEDDLEEGEDE